MDAGATPPRGAKPPKEPRAVVARQPKEKGGGATEGSGASEKGRGPPERSERGAGAPARMPASVGQRPKGAPNLGQNI